MILILRKYDTYINSLQGRYNQIYISLKYGCFKASRADIRFVLSNINIF